MVTKETALAEKFGLRTTYVDNSTTIFTFYPEFIQALQEAVAKDGKLEIAFFQLQQPTDKGFSHKFFTKKELIKALKNKR